MSNRKWTKAEDEEYEAYLERKSELFNSDNKEDVDEALCMNLSKEEYFKIKEQDKRRKNEAGKKEKEEIFTMLDKIGCSNKFYMFTHSIT